MNKTNQAWHYAWLITTSLLISACTTQSPQNSTAMVEQALSKQYPEINFSVMHTPHPITQNTLADRFSLQQAIHTLLSRSPQVRIQLAELGIADAERLQAELISNPHISLGAMKPEDGGRWQLESGLSQPLLGLFTRPLRRQLAEDALLNKQLHLQIALQELIATTSDYYFSAVAAQQDLQIQDHMYQTTLARQQLALAMLQAGNMSENNFLYYDNEFRRAQQSLEKRKTETQETQLQLLNMIGLPSTEIIKLPNQLTLAPEESFYHAALLEKAKHYRLDMKIAQQQLTILKKRRQLVVKENGWRDMNIGINAERESDGATNVGPEIEFALPIFNRSQGKIAATDAKIFRVQAQLQQYALDADTQIAQAINQMTSAKTQLMILGNALKMAEKRVTLSNREVNFMLASPFELLNIKRQEIQLAHDYTRELKNYWQARSQLELAIGRALPLPANNSSQSDSDHSKMDHSKMDHSKMDHSNHQQDTDVKDTKKSNSHFNHQEH